MIVVAARSILTFACLMVIGSLLMLVFVKPGTGEFVITVVTLLLGGLLLAIAATILRTAYVRETTVIEVEDLSEHPATPQNNTRARSGRTKEEM